MRIELEEKNPRGLWVWKSKPQGVVTVQVSQLFDTIQRCLAVQFAKSYNCHDKATLRPLLIADDMVAWFVAVDLVGHLSKLDKTEDYETTQLEIGRCLQAFAKEYGWCGNDAKMVITDKHFKIRQNRDKEESSGQVVESQTTKSDELAAQI